jgi:D-glycero-alpha-D-manno-heptose-7-phosphate kinase
MSIILTQAPLRISLGGGGTDLPSYYREHGGFLVGGAIDKYVYLITHTTFQRRFHLKYSQTEEVDEPAAIRHPIFRETLTRHWRGAPLEIASVADVPAGTGLGSSSSFTACLLKALSLARGVATTPAGLAEDACAIEIGALAEPIGKQDQYVSAHGGICAYTFHPDDSVDVRPLDLGEETLGRLRDHLLLFYSGEARSAGAVLDDQRRRTEEGDAAMVANLERIKELGRESCALLEAGDLERYAERMHEHWEAKRQRSPGITNEHIDELYLLARRSGAIGGKLVGAGGGGFLMVYSPQPDATRQAMAARGARELRFDFEFLGARGTVSS